MGALFPTSPGHRAGDDDGVASAPSVIHLVSDFVAPSEPWLYDLVRAPGTHGPRVVCERRINESEFPFEPVEPGLPTTRRYGWDWFSRQATATRLVRLDPRDRWRGELHRRRLTADVFHAHFGPAAWMAVDGGLSPVVASFYGYDATVTKVIRHWRRRYRELFAGGGLFVAEGPAMGRRLIALGAPPERVRVLPLIADVESLSWREPDVAGDVQVVMAGRFVEKKGFALGVRAFADATADKAASLVLMGTGPEEGRLKGLVRSLGLADRVTFLPFASRAAYRELLEGADIVLQPSVTARNGDCEGGAPTVLLDALAIGPVVVASEHADIPFVVDPSAAYLAPEADVGRLTEALAAALASRDEWTDRSAAGRRHVERQHARDAVARLRDDIYAEAAQAVGP